MIFAAAGGFWNRKGQGARRFNIDKSRNDSEKEKQS